MAVVKLVLLLACAVFLSGCVDNDKIMASWEGHDVSDVITSWGPPGQVLDDPPGKIMTWFSQRNFVSPGYSQTNSTGSAYIDGNTISGQSQSYTTTMPARVSGYTATRTFWVNGQGKIYRWAWRGH